MRKIEVGTRFFLYFIFSGLQNILYHASGKPMEENPCPDSEVIRAIVSKSVADIRARRERDKAAFVGVIQEWIKGGRRGKLFGGKKMDRVAKWIQDEWENNPSFVHEIGKLAGLSTEELEAVTQQRVDEAMEDVSFSLPGEDLGTIRISDSNGEEKEVSIRELTTGIDSRKITVFDTEESIRRYSNFGVGDDFIERMLDDYNTPDVIGRYFPEIGEVMLYQNNILRNRATQDEVKAIIVHENVHALSGGLYSEEDFSKTAELIKTVSPDFYDKIQQIDKGCVKKEIDEDVVCYYIDQCVRSGQFDELMNRELDFSNNELNARIDYIVELLRDRNYGKEKKAVQIDGQGKSEAVRENSQTNSNSSRGRTDPRRGGTLGRSEGTDSGGQEERGTVDNSADFSIAPEEDTYSGEDVSFSLGVPYQGSKSRIAKKIVERLSRGGRFVDLFSGGGAVTHAAMLSGKYGRYRMNDLDGVGQDLFLQGVRGEWKDYDRTSMTPEEFAQIKGTPEALPWSHNAYGTNLVKNDSISVVSPTSLMHVMYGAVNIDNKNYRAKLFVAE